MTPHLWSRAVPIYEAFAAHKCRQCGAVCFSGNDPPESDDLAAQAVDGPMPEDCEATKPMVAAGKFAWDQKELPPWDENEVGKWSWPDE
jgi:hypothetical protein